MAEKSLIRDSSDNGMLPLFNLVNSFIDDLVPTTLSDIIEEHNIVTTDDFANVELKEWLLMLVGLVICLGVGVLFLVIFPLCACCYCCCRCLCGSCQPELKMRYGKTANKQPSTCKKWTCSSIFFVLVATMLSVIICSFIATSMVKDEIGEDGKAMDDLILGFDYLESYLHDSIDDIEEAVFPPLNETKHEVYNILDQLPETTVQTLAKETGVDPALYELDDYAQNIPTLNGNLTIMDEKTNDLIPAETNLDSELGIARSNIGTHLNDCYNDHQTMLCDQLLAQLSDLKPGAQYDNFSNVTSAIIVSEFAIASQVPEVVAIFVDNFESISTDIEDEIGTQIDDIKTQIDDIQETLEEEFNRISNEVKNTTFDGVTDSIEDYKPEVEMVGTWIYKILYGISTLCLIPVFLYLCGLPLGLFGGPGAARHGSNCLMAGISITFIFGFLFMLITTVTFAIGGAMQGGLCRHVIGYDNTMQDLETVLRATYREKNGNDPYNLTVKEFIDNCRMDTALYTAFKFAENGFNISEYLDLDNTPLPDVINGLKNITFNIDPVEIITEDVNNTVLALETETDKIDFDYYNQELSKGVTVLNVSEYAHTLRLAANEIRASGDASLADALDDEAKNLDEIYTDIILDMETDKDELSQATNSSYTITSAVSLSKVMFDLTTAEDIINTEADDMIQEIVGDSADGVYNLLNDFTKGLAKSVENDIAKCRPAYDAVTTITYVPCVYFLYPFNAVWFSYGWYIAFGFIAIFFSTSITSMFRIKGLGNKIQPQRDDSSYSGSAIALNQVAPMSQGNVCVTDKGEISIATNGENSTWQVSPGWDIPPDDVKDY